MSSTIDSFISETTRQAAPLEKAYTLAEWEAATKGTPESYRRPTEPLRRPTCASGPTRTVCAPPRNCASSGGALDPLTARQLTLIYLTAASNQQDEATLEELAQVEAEVRERYTNFRAQVDGAALNDNQIDEILSKTSDADEARRIWEGSKQVGAEVADRIRQLARVRNRAAHAHGFRDHFERSLSVTEIDEDQLFAIFDDLERKSRRPFQDLKAAIDRSRSTRFGVPAADLRPWHYTDRFFQKPDPLGEVDLDALFADRDPVALATATYDGLGLDVRAILSRSDLYPRPGKNQHAFCTHIDRQGDIRTLNNVEPNERWTETLHHELGHGVYEQHLDPSLPWLLRAPAHILSTEAIATADGRRPPRAGVADERARGRAGPSLGDCGRRPRARARLLLVFTRWCLVMTHFERGLYADPEADLDSLWWDLVERHQQIPRPEGRHAPDWAAKIHVALFPVYYHNYELGLLVRAQLRAAIQREVGGLVGREQAGAWLIEHVFRPGASLDWNQHVAAATGEPLTPRYFVEVDGMRTIRRVLAIGIRTRDWTW